MDGSVNTYSAGTYSLTYKVQDNYGNEAAVTRTVTVEPVRQADTVKPSGKIVYLTFDDGPGEYTSKLLDILSKYNVKATFFTVGSGHPDLLKAEADAGHSIGIHSATHDYSKIYASEDAFFADLRKQQDTIENATGIPDNPCPFSRRKLQYRQQKLLLRYYDQTDQRPHGYGISVF